MSHDHDHRSDDELYELEIYHRYDHERNRRNLRHLYGVVAEAQDRLIERHILGRTVLDAGAGYGLLTRRLRAAGLQVTAIDPNAESRGLAREWFDVDVEDGDIYATRFPDRSFDTVVLREVSEHLDLERALPEITRVARRAVILFHTNVTPLVQVMRALARHHEYRSPTQAFYLDHLAAARLRVDAVVHRDIFAFPLSGGFTTRQWIPPVSAAYRPIVAIDDALAAVLRSVGLAPALAWRVLIRALTPET